MSTKNKGGRPRKLKRGSGRKPKNLDPVSQASVDFENDVLEGICRDMNLDEIG